jgi:hypothetical protein
VDFGGQVVVTLVFAVPVRVKQVVAILVSVLPTAAHVLVSNQGVLRWIKAVRKGRFFYSPNSSID